MRLSHIARIARRPLARTAALAAGLALGGCSTDSVTVIDPDVIANEAVTNASGAVAIRNGAVRDFAVVFSGTQDGFIVSTGNLADEVNATDTFFDRLLPNERAIPNNLPAMDTYYTNLHRARTGAARAIRLWAAVKPAAKDSLGELYAIRGFTEDFFGEGYCSGVPFSDEIDGEIAYGDPLTTPQIFQRALASFDTALANATSAGFRNLAAVGRGRALLNLGRFADAAAAVADVPTSFRYQTFHSAATGAQNNGVWNGTSVPSSRYTVANNEGTNGLNYLQTPADPRMPWQTSTRTGFDGTSRNLPTQMKYPLNSSPATLADGVEARLIGLEARLQGGTQADRDAVFAGLNDLRRTAITPAIAAIAGSAPTSQAAAVDLLFRERAYWLWLTGHRLGDMRRLVRQYGRTAETVFPVGPVATRFGSTYGNDVNFPVPFNETNNPKFTGCIDRRA
jgi:starch-binding outer membrane protein, SusD/RagB family